MNVVVTNFKIARLFHHADRFVPDVLREIRRKYPENIKWALWIRKPSMEDIFWKILCLFPSGHVNIFPWVEWLVILKRDMVNAILRGELNISNIDSLDEKTRQRVLAIFPEKEMRPREKRWVKYENIYAQYIAELEDAQMKMEFLQKVANLSVTIDDILNIEKFSKYGTKHMLEIYNQLLERKWQGHKKLTMPKKRKKIILPWELVRAPDVGADIPIAERMTRLYGNYWK